MNQLEIKIDQSDKRNWDKKWRAVINSEYRLYGTNESELQEAIKYLIEGYETQDVPKELVEYAKNQVSDYFFNLGSWDEDELFDCEHDILEKAASIVGINLTEQEQLDLGYKIGAILNVCTFKNETRTMWITEQIAKFAWKLVKDYKDNK